MFCMYALVYLLHYIGGIVAIFIQINSSDLEKQRWRWDKMEP